jgi:DNA-binding NtrC family response regulator
MFNGSPTPAQHSPSNAPQPGHASLEDAAVSACPPFVCVSSTLRRLLLQAEITAPRLHLATLEGEAGSGKHLLAQHIHRQSDLANQPFRRRDAREWLANESDASALSGTLYLDRVDLLAAAGQGLLLKLIKMLQNDSASPPHFLLLVSTHATLRQLAGQGVFLPDLAFRLTAVRFSIPPLREHREDIAPIVQALIDRICRRYQQPTAALAPGTLPRLLQHGWPGNVRELASVLESAILDSTTGLIRPNDLALHIPREAVAPALPNPSAAPIELPGDLTLDAAVHRHIQLILDLNRGNKLRAARQLGISRSTLYRLLSGASIAPKTN